MSSLTSSTITVRGDTYRWRRPHTLVAWSKCRKSEAFITGTNAEPPEQIYSAMSVCRVST
jgi:hypothetical protein